MYSKHLLFSLCVAASSLVTRVACSAETSPPNVLLICIDDLRPELNSFGASYIHSPNIDQLASDGRAFLNHYVNAPSCGPSRYTMLTGRYGPYGNHALFDRAQQLATDPTAATPTMPEWFRQHGYTTVSIGKVSHNPGGLGGANWNDTSKVEIPNAWDKQLMPSGAWINPKGIMHGLAHGEIRKNAKEMDVYQAVEGPDDIYPDGLITNEALAQLEQLTQDSGKPFFLAVGIIRPHLPFGAPKKYLDLYEGVELPPIAHPEKPQCKSTWHNSGEFMKYNLWGKKPNEDAAFAIELRRHYAACVSYADAQVGRIMEKLKASGADKNTIIVLWGDHGWHLGERAIWGKHSLFEEALHSPLIIRAPGVKQAGTPTKAIVETVDIFPTLCELVQLPPPHYTHGTSLLPQLRNADTAGHTAIAYKGKAATIRNATHRLTTHPTGHYELYEYANSNNGSINIVEHNAPLITDLELQLKIKLLKKRK